MKTHLQMKPRASVLVDFSSTLAALRSPCTMPRPCKYCIPVAMSSRLLYTKPCKQLSLLKLQHNVKDLILSMAQPAYALPAIGYVTAATATHSTIPQVHTGVATARATVCKSGKGAQPTMSRVRVARLRKRPLPMACSSEPRSAYSRSIHVSISSPCCNNLHQLYCRSLRLLRGDCRTQIESRPSGCELRRTAVQIRPTCRNQNVCMRT